MESVGTLCIKGSKERTWKWFSALPGGGQEHQQEGMGIFFFASTNMPQEDDHINPAVFVVVVYLQHEAFHLESLCCHSSYNRLKAQHLAPSSAVKGWKGSASLC